MHGGPTPRRRLQRVEAAVLAVPAVVASGAALLVARYGAYASPDSVFYVGVARALRDSFELVAPPGSQPLAHFPPLFPAVLAAVSAVLGVDPLDAAEVVNPLLFGATVLLVAVVVRHRTGSTAWGVGAAAALGVARDVLVFGASALSEPLFTLLAVAALVALAASIERRSAALLVAATTLVALACLTRYAGAALLVSGTAALVRFEGRRGGPRAVAFAAGAAAPLGVWLVAVGRTNRHVRWHLFDLEYWTTGVDAVFRWVAPTFLPWPVRAVVAPAALVTLWWVVRRVPRRSSTGATSGTAGSDPLPFVLGAFAAAYLALLVADRLLLDDSGRLDGRFLLPLHVMAVIGLAPVLHRAATGPLGRAVAWTAGLLVTLHAVQAVSWAVTGVGDDSVGRRGLAAAAWKESAVLARVAALPESVAVYTNGPDALYLHTGRRATSLPAHRDILTGEPEDEYAQQMDAVARQLRRGGVVVYLAPLSFRDAFLATTEEVDRAIPLEQVAADELAALYRPAP